jgi:hypothetical protein
LTLKIRIMAKTKKMKTNTKAGTMMCHAARVCGGGKQKADGKSVGASMNHRRPSMEVGQKERRSRPAAPACAGCARMSLRAIGSIN